MDYPDDFSVKLMGIREAWNVFVAAWRLYDFAYVLECIRVLRDECNKVLDEYQPERVGKAS